MSIAIKISDYIEKRRAKLAIEDFKKLCEFYKVSADDLPELNIDDK